MFKKVLKRILYFFIAILFLIAGLTAWSEFESRSFSTPSSSPLPQTTTITGTNTPDQAQEGPAVQVDVNGIVAVSQQPGNNVILDVVLERPGYLIIREETNGQPGTIIGKSQLLSEGGIMSVAIALNRKTITGETLYASLYFEQNNNNTFEPQIDRPVFRRTGELLIDKLQVTTETQ